MHDKSGPLSTNHDALADREAIRLACLVLADYHISADALTAARQASAAILDAEQKLILDRKLPNTYEVIRTSRFKPGKCNPYTETLPGRLDGPCTLPGRDKPGKWVECNPYTETIDRTQWDFPIGQKQIIATRLASCEGHYGALCTLADGMGPVMPETLLRCAVLRMYCKAIARRFSAPRPHDVSDFDWGALHADLQLAREQAERMLLGAAPVQGVGEPQPILLAGPSKKPSKKSMALVLLLEHADWTNQQIADAVPCHVKTLNRYPEFKKARLLLKAGRDEVPKGRKDAETGEVEAW